MKTTNIQINRDGLKTEMLRVCKALNISQGQISAAIYDGDTNYISRCLNRGIIGENELNKLADMYRVNKDKVLPIKEGLFSEQSAPEKPAASNTELLTAVKALTAEVQALKQAVTELPIYDAVTLKTIITDVVKSNAVTAQIQAGIKLSRDDLTEDIMYGILKAEKRKAAK